MTITDANAVKAIADNFKCASARSFALSEEDKNSVFQVACQISLALVSVLDRPKEELSDRVIVDAIALAVSDILCTLVDRDDKINGVAWVHMASRVNGALPLAFRVT